VSLPPNAVRWLVTSAVAAGAFAASWWLCDAQAQLDTQSAVGVATAVAAVLGAPLGWWAGREPARDDTVPPPGPRRLPSLRTRRAYLRFVVARNYDVDMRGLGTHGPFSLDVQSIFVDVGLVFVPAHAAAGGLLGAADSLPLQASSRGPVWDYLDRWPPRTLVIVGPPGSGKTTLLKHLTLKVASRRAAEAGPARTKIPVLLLLRDSVQQIVGSGEASLADVAAASLPSGVRPSADWFRRQLRKGNCLVMMDSLDEVADPVHRKALVEWIRAQIAQYGDNGFIVTSRPSGYLANPLAAADVVQIRPFTGHQIETFLRRWYLANEVRHTGRRDEVVLSDADERADDLLHRLRNAPLLYDLGANPLLLTMIAHVHNYRGMLPGGRAELYREIFQVFLGQRQEAKGLTVRLTYVQRESVLRHLAVEMMNRRLRDVSIAEAASIIADQLARVAPDEDAEHFLIDTEQVSGLIVQRENGTFSFAHLTFQEYLAAARIREKGLVGSLAEKVADPWWREVILLYSAQADAGPIVAACLTQATSSRALLLALDSAEIARELDPGLRDRLARTMSDQSRSDDPERAQVIGEILLGRRVRRVRYGVGGMVVTEPITNGEYALFVRSEAALGRDRRPVHWSDKLVAAAPDAPVNGVSEADARAFGDWLSFSEGWTYEPVADHAPDPDVADRSDVAVLRQWASDVDWAGVRRFAPEDIVSAAAFLEDIAGSDTFDGHERDKLRTRWAELRAAFDAHVRDDSRIGALGLHGDAWTVTRLLRVLTEAYAGGDWVALKMWQLEVVDGLFADEEIEEIPIAVSLESGAGQLLMRSASGEIGRQIFTLGRNVKNFRSRTKADLPAPVEDKLEYATELLSRKWRDWHRLEERDADRLHQCRAAALAVHTSVPHTKSTEEPIVRPAAKLLEEFVLLDWQSRGLLRAGPELWLRRC
jgi:energy-coupling factor transporter ATP-binding protein EcfA2